MRADVAPAVVTAAHARGATIRVTMEAVLLHDVQRIGACELSEAAGADYVKTSTGFAGGGATIEDGAPIRKTVGPEVGVKTAGKTHDAADARALVQQARRGSELPPRCRSPRGPDPLRTGLDRSARGIPLQKRTRLR